MNRSTYFACIFLNFLALSFPIIAMQNLEQNQEGQGLISGDSAPVGPSNVPWIVRQFSTSEHINEVNTFCDCCQKCMPVTLPALGWFVGYLMGTHNNKCE